ncbi:hypothetical protein N0V88_007322 [Collariella sp. IMI 366227]|nr:hypothetical protein N0V88_007322 [Collariella sp. IMI 366227]
MSEIIDSIKDAVNPKRREQATTETYDPKKRGPYAEDPTPSVNEPELSPPKEAQDPARAEQSDLSQTGQRSQMLNTSEPGTGPNRSPKVASNTKFHAPEGTYGPHKSRIVNVLDPRVDSDRDGKPSHGLSDVGPAGSKPVHKEGGKYGLS